MVRGSIPYWDQTNAVKSMTDHADELNQVALFWYYINPDGQITKYQYAQADPNILATAHAHHIKTLFTITNLGEQAGDDWDSTRVEKVIGDNASRSSHINSIMSMFNKLPFDGVTIDYEQVAPSQRSNFTVFIRQLAARLHQQNKLLNVALHPITSSEAAGRYYFQDDASLAQSADYVTVMTYDEHENGSSAGPIASYPWVSQAVAYLKNNNLPMHKVFLGIPVYGYDWIQDSNSPATDLTYQDTQIKLGKLDEALKWDNAAKSPYFSYIDQGQSHTVWFENAESIDQKLKLAQANHLGGVSLWRLGEEDPAIWPKISAYQ